MADDKPNSEPKQKSDVNGAGVDLDELARKVTQLLLFELQIENDRLGRN